MGMSRATLKANAAASAVAAVPLVAAPGTLAPLFAAEGASWLLPAVGVVLLAFAAWVWWVSSLRPLAPAWVRAVSAADYTWVAGSVALLALLWTDLPSLGRWVLVLQADAVALAGTLQLYGLRRASRRAAPA